MKWTLKIWCLLIVVFSACEDEDEPLFSVIPEISIEEIQPTEIIEFTDSIEIILNYQDGDGNLGFANPDSFAMEIQDTRFQNPDLYYVPLLAPLGEVISIKGELRVVVRGTFLVGNGAQETTTFLIRLKDRTGNWSNTLTSPKITILPQ